MSFQMPCGNSRQTDNSRQDLAFSELFCFNWQLIDNLFIREKRRAFTRAYNFWTSVYITIELFSYWGRGKTVMVRPSISGLICWLFVHTLREFSFWLSWWSSQFRNHMKDLNRFNWHKTVALQLELLALFCWF